MESSHLLSTKIMNEFYSGTLFCLLLQFLRTSCTVDLLAEETEHLSVRQYYECYKFLRTRVRDFIFSHSKSLENETGEYNPSKLDSIVVTGSTVARERTRLFADIVASTRDPIENKYLYNHGIRLLGVENFLSTAVQFCKTEARGGKIDIVSIGSGDGYVEKRIVDEYRECGGNPSPLNIILVDPDERYRSEVHFKYVDDLIGKNPRIVGNCVLFIFCPLPEPSNDGYDIHSIRKLKPKAILSEYDATGVSGSKDFVRFLDPEGDYDEEYCVSHGLDYYPIKEIALQVKYRGMDIRLIKVKKTNTDGA